MLESKLDAIEIEINAAYNNFETDLLNISGISSENEDYINDEFDNMSDQKDSLIGWLGGFTIADICGGCPPLGDLNGDDTWNVLDIVNLANCVLGQNCPNIQYGCAGDMNGDGAFNVLDIVTLANCVLAQNCGG